MSVLFDPLPTLILAHTHTHTHTRTHTHTPGCLLIPPLVPHSLFFPFLLEGKCLVSNASSHVYNQSFPWDWFALPA